MEQTDLRYLKSLAKQYPTVAAAATEIINLQAILSLPKGTELRTQAGHGRGVRTRELSSAPERGTAQTARQGPQVRAEWQRMCVRPDSQEVGLEAATPSKSA